MIKRSSWIIVLLFALSACTSTPPKQSFKETFKNDSYASYLPQTPMCWRPENGHVSLLKTDTKALNLPVRLRAQDPMASMFDVSREPNTYHDKFLEDLVKGGYINVATVSNGVWDLSISQKGKNVLGFFNEKQGFCIGQIKVVSFNTYENANNSITIPNTVIELAPGALRKDFANL